MKASTGNLCKRLLALLLALMLLLALAACGAQTEDAGSTDEEETTTEDTQEEAQEDSQEEEESQPEETEPEAETEADSTYSLIQNVYNWGSSYSSIILPVSGEADYTDASAYTVSVQRYDTAGELLDEGERTVTGAYLSDAAGAEDAEGGYVTLTMEVAADMSVAQPYYTDPNSYRSNLKSWAD